MKRYILLSAVSALFFGGMNFGMQEEVQKIENIELRATLIKNDKKVKSLENQQLNLQEPKKYGLIIEEIFLERIEAIRIDMPVAGKNKNDYDK
jgi:hypothetical protein